MFDRNTVFMFVFRATQYLVRRPGVLYCFEENNICIYNNGV